MNEANPKVDGFLNREHHWRKEYEKLREILRESPLEEELKWGVPCYAVAGKNVVLMHGFKEYCALLFVKGALFEDPAGILIQQTENVQSARQIRFTSVEQIEEMEHILKAYIQQAIEVERSGKKIEFKKPEEFKVADEFQLVLDDNPAVKTAFEALTPGRQRAYLLFFSSPKQSRTRQDRVEKSIPAILEGKGLND